MVALLDESTRSAFTRRMKVRKHQIKSSNEPDARQASRTPPALLFTGGFHVCYANAQRYRWFFRSASFTIPRAMAGKLNF